MVDIGLDGSFFNNKLTLTLDFYDRQTNQLLLYVPHPSTDGQKVFPAQNVGSVENKGMDLLIAYNGASASKKFTYGVSVNFSVYNNNVTRLYAGSDAYISGTNTRTAVGHPIGAFYGLDALGIFQSDAEAAKWPAQFGNPAVFNKAGRVKFRDVDGDGVIDPAKDQTFIGSPIPKYSYGINLSIAMYGFDMALFIQGVYGNKIFNSLKYVTDWPYNAYAVSDRVRDAWSPNHTSGKVPEVNSLAAGLESAPSSYMVENGSYLRGKSLQIGYSVPLKSLSKVKIDRLRFYLSATNLFTITSYTGVDPEVTQAAGDQNSRGNDQGIYPFSKTYTFGLQLGF